MTPKELFERLQNTGNHYSYFKRNESTIDFSTGGWSENEELVSELKQEFVWKILLIKWERGGHYTFKIPDTKTYHYDFEKEGWLAKIKKGSKMNKKEIEKQEMKVALLESDIVRLEQQSQKVFEELQKQKEKYEIVHLKIRNKKKKLKELEKNDNSAS